MTLQSVIPALSLAGSIGFLLPMTMALALVLLLRGFALLALQWLGCLGLTIVLTLGVKAISAGSASLPYFPSGHVALAVAFFCGLALLLAPPAAARLVVPPVAVVAGGLVGLSRVLITDHTVADVLGGILAGLGPLLLLGRPLRQARPDPTTSQALLLVTLGFAPLAKLVHDSIDAPIRQLLAF